MAIKKNMGLLDRLARIIIGIGLIYFGLFDITLVDNQTVRYIMAVFGVVNIITSVVAFCPLYVMANLSTASK